jgi:hypothetical protein
MKDTNQRTPAWKVSISFPGRLKSYIQARQEAFDGSLSAYMQSLVEAEIQEEDAGSAAVMEHRRAVAAALPAKSRVKDHGTIVAKQDGVGYFPVMRYQSRDLLREVAFIASAVQEYDLEEVVLVLPDDGTESDLINWGQVRNAGMTPRLKVVLLRNVSQ